MKQGYMHIGVALDSSGSMHTVQDDTIGGMNSFIENQQSKGGETTFTLVDFASTAKTTYDFVNIKDAPKLTRDNYRPDGMTALLDGMGKLIDDTGKKLATMAEDERPEKVLIVVQTDGGENSSKDYTKARIREMIKHQQDAYNWEFIFLGANQDAITTGTSYGFSATKSMSYASNVVGSAAAYRTMNRVSDVFRETDIGYYAANKDVTAVTQEERDEQKAAGA